MHRRPTSDQRAICVALGKAIVMGTLVSLLTSCSDPLPPFGVSIEYSHASSAGLGFEARASSTPTSYSWDFGDGSSSAEASPAHTYGIRGTYTVNLNVFDDEGRLASSHVNVTVGHDWHVPRDAGVQGVIDAASEGDTVFVAKDAGPILVEKEIEIVAEGQCTLSVVEYRGVSGLLRGFTLTKAKQRYKEEVPKPALTLTAASPRIENCTFSEGDAVYGGAVFAQDSAAQFHDCLFVGNRAQLGGGAVYAVGSQAFPSFFDCTFRNNQSDNAGGALLVSLGDSSIDKPSTQFLPHVENCSFVNNRGHQNPSMSGKMVGGAIHIGTGCRVILRGNSFSGNSPADVIYEDLL